MRKAQTQLERPSFFSASATLISSNPCDTFGRSVTAVWCAPPFIPPTPPARLWRPCIRPPVARLLPTCRSCAQGVLTSRVPLIGGGWGARCRASFLHRREDGSPLGLQQHHDEPGRRRGTGVAPHDVHIGRTLVERLPCRERHGR